MPTEGPVIATIFPLAVTLRIAAALISQPPTLRAVGESSDVPVPPGCGVEQVCAQTGGGRRRPRTQCKDSFI